jgi:hypothetical protein
MKYKVGDKVVIRSWQDMAKQFGLDRYGDIKTKVCFVGEMRKYCGTEMTISKIYGDDDNFSMEGSCFYFSKDMFEKKNCNQKIVITSDGTETLARLYKSGKIVKSATAKCSPEDEFNFSIGAKLAFDRLVESIAEEKKKGYSGKVVCISTENLSYFTIGKIYEFENGFTRDDGGDKRPSFGKCEKRVKSLDDEWASGKFIPLVED